MTGQQAVPAGWYAMQGDPPNTQRWWDGVQWTGQPRLIEAVAVPVAPQATATVVAEEPVEYGSMLSNDLASYWESMDDKPVAQFTDTFGDEELTNDEQDGGYLTPTHSTNGEGQGHPDSPVKWMLLPYKNYVNFGGRSCRAEFWWFLLFVTVAQIALGLLGAALGVGYSSVAGVEQGGDDGFGLVFVVFAPVVLFSLGSIIPGLALQVRRLHDTGRSATPLFLLPVLPIFAFVLMLLLGPDAAPVFALLLLLIGVYSLWLTVVIYFMPGNSGWNKYGDTHITPF